VTARVKMRRSRSLATPFQGGGADYQVNVAVNRGFARADTPARDGDEVAVVPSHPL
jgi:molybdopterin converting factor small subunit